MTIDRLREPRGVEQQIYPILESMGIGRGYYTNNIDEITDKLVTTGKVKKLELGGSRIAQLRKTLEEVVNLNDDQHLILPSDSNIFYRVNDETRHSKLPLAHVPRYSGLPSHKKHKTLWVLTKEMLNSLSIGSLYDGYDWQGEGRNDSRIRVVQLVDCAKGKVIAEDPASGIVVKDYAIKKSAKKTYREGINMLVERVPSLSDKPKTYDVALTHVPFFYNYQLYNGMPKREQAKDTFLLDTNHQCEKSIPLYLSYGRKYQSSDNKRLASEMYMDAHVIAADFAVQDYVKAEHKEGVIANTFYRPTDDFMDVFWKLYTQTLKEAQNPVSKHIVRNPLDMVDIENLLWNYIGYRNEKLGLVAKRK